MKRLDQLLAADELDALGLHAAALEVVQLAYDARAVRAPALFAAWRGGRHDGHDHLREAEARGAVCALTQRHVEGVTLPQLVCADPRRVLARAARAFYDAPDAAMTTVAVTGTNGKTTCAQLLASVLAAWRGAAAAVGTLGVRRYAVRAGGGDPQAAPAGVAAALTTPEAPELVALLRALADDGVAATALEASSIALDQGRLDGVQLNVAAWSNTSQDHLDYHKTLDAYAAAKARLFAGRLKPGGWAVLHADDPHQAQVAAPRTLRFGVAARRPSGPPADVFVAAGGPGRDGIAVDVHTPRGPLTLRSPLLGAFNVENLLLVVAVAEALGVPHEAVRRGVAALAGVDGRLEVVPSPRAGAAAPLLAVDYAHTPDALVRVLAALRPTTSGRLWCVFGCGGERDPDKRAKMGAAVARGADLAVVTNDNPRGEAPEAIAAAVVAGLRAAGATPAADVAALAASGRGNAVPSMPPAPPRGAETSPSTAARSLATAATSLRTAAASAPHGPRQVRFTVTLDRAAAIAGAVAAAAPGDTVLLAGKGHETTQILGGTSHPFDDRVHAREALLARDAAVHA